jgi:hypothetical protein
MKIEQQEPKQNSTKIDWRVSKHTNSKNGYTTWLTCNWIGLNQMMTNFLVICSQRMILMN